MKKILLVGNAPFFRDLVSFLLRLAGFDPVLARDLEEAINLIEIKRSIQSSFDLLIVAQNDIDYGICLYENFFNRCTDTLKILVIAKGSGSLSTGSCADPFFASENVHFCQVENLVCETRKILDKNAINDDHPGNIEVQ
ncbi:MAG: hypothetical protein R2940_08465 [Syntrophotaleaceae bacterium]